MSEHFWRLDRLLGILPEKEHDKERDEEQGEEHALLIPLLSL